jgi:hypothetical protein
MKVAQDESVLGRFDRKGIQSRQGRLRACLRSQSKNLFPYERAKAEFSRPSGLMSVFAILPRTS